MPLRFGFDIGSTRAKAVLVDEADTLVDAETAPTGPDGEETAGRLRERLLARHPEAAAAAAVATGYGRARVGFPARTVTEITCHARGVRALHGEASTVVDIGGQDSKAIRLGPDGAVLDFAMNDRCAAGTGAFLETVCRRFDVSLEDLGRLHEKAPTPLEISATCVVFAESEVVGLLARGHPLEDVLAGVLRAVARRTVALVRKVRGTGPVDFTGGVAQNESLRRELETELVLPVRRVDRPRLTGALGAALLAG